MVLAVKLACRVSEELQVLGVRPRHTRHVGDALARALEQLVSQARIDVAPRGCRGAHGRHAVAGERALELVAADLDEVIERLADDKPFDQLKLQRLKKRKLVLKDEMTLIRSRILPDIIA